MTEEENRRRAEALLEQLRRLEQDVSALRTGLSPHSEAPEREGTNVNPEEFTGHTEEMIVNYRDSIVYDKERAAEPQGIQQNPEARQSVPELSAQRTGQIHRGQVLLEQLERLEWTVEPQVSFRSVLSGQDSPQNRIVNQNVKMNYDSRGSSGWRVSSGSRREDIPLGGELRQAERTDRIFRRDSRRYDGGFTLY